MFMHALVQTASWKSMTNNVVLLVLDFNSCIQSFNCIIAFAANSIIWATYIEQASAYNEFV